MIDIPVDVMEMMEVMEMGMMGMMVMMVFFLDDWPCSVIYPLHIVGSVRWV